VGTAIPQRLEDVHRVLADLWREVDGIWSRPPDAAWRAQFATGVGEIGANIIQYAYPSDVPGILALRLRVFDHCIEACFSDHGRPYEGDVAAQVQLEPPDPLLLADSGRGIALARAAVDDLTYERAPGGTNRWCLTKRSGAVR
jgi:serine/threonine-protein kinase RsbW